MARPTAYPARKLIGFDPAMLERVEGFRRRHGVSTESEAIRRLIDLGLRGGLEATTLLLPTDLAGVVEEWRRQHAPGLDQGEVVCLLVRRGISRTAADGAGPIEAPRRAPPAAPPEPPPTPASDLPLDPDTARRVEDFRQALAEPPGRAELLAQLVVVFEDRMEGDLAFYQGEVMPQGTRAQAIERLVRQGLAEYLEQDAPAAS